MAYNIINNIENCQKGKINCLIQMTLNMIKMSSQAERGDLILYR